MGAETVYSPSGAIQSMSPVTPLGTSARKVIACGFLYMPENVSGRDSLSDLEIRPKGPAFLLVERAAAGPN